MQGQRFGFVALCGCPNAGKSTFLNCITQKKLAAISDKSQTTRTNILGITQHESSEYTTQIAWIDTPGLAVGNTPLNKVLRKNTHQAVKSVDAIVFLIDISKKNQNTEALQHFINYHKGRNIPLFVAFNKIDQVKPADLIVRTQIFEPFKDAVHDFFMISALREVGISSLVDYVAQTLPVQNWMYPKDYDTVNLERWACEMVMEQIFQQLSQEVPYRICVAFIHQENKDDGLHLYQNIVVAKENYKAIVIGKKGQRLRLIGQNARQIISHHLSQRVHLHLFVKVIPQWETKREFFEAEI